MHIAIEVVGGLLFANSHEFGLSAKLVDLKSFAKTLQICAENRGVDFVCLLFDENVSYDMPTEKVAKTVYNHYRGKL
jgi:hypothetical protein